MNFQHPLLLVFEISGVPSPKFCTQYFPNLSTCKDDKTTFDFETKDYVSKAVSGTKVNIVDVFNYEFPTSSSSCV